jgi:saccharopine dehydrogenase (NAD+, L-lysine forming)
MLKFGLIREEKIPADNRVALTPAQCKWLHKNFPDIRVFAETSPNRCYTDAEYTRAGVVLQENVDDCDVLFGIKEVPVQKLVPGKTYLFFSHTKKKQPHNRQLLKTILEKDITLIDYECLEHEDGQRILGFGFFAGVVGAHNGLMAYGRRTGAFDLGRVYVCKSLQELIHTYFGLKLPHIKVAVTGSGRVAHGLLEVMNLVGIHEVEPDDYLERTFTYPVYTHLKGAHLYAHKETGKYNRLDFHAHPAQYRCLFQPYTQVTDILMNGIYWDKDIPRLFEWEDMTQPGFAIQTIADVTDDTNGSVPCNLGDGTIENPVYGVNKFTRQQTAPYLPDSVDVMAVGNLPNELPRDASRYFGEQLIKYVLEDIVKGGSVIIDHATIAKAGALTPHFEYLTDYVS